MRGYTTRDVAELLGISPARVRTFARSGLLSGNKGADGEYRLTFEDIVLIRTAQELSAADIHARKVWRALRGLQRQLPSGKSLTSVRITLEADQLVVREKATAWHPESGQLSFSFSVQDLANQVAPLVRSEAAAAHRNRDLSSDDWYALGVDLELIRAWDDARAAYRIAIEFDPLHVDSHINLGRLLQMAGELERAEQHYRKAVEIEPQNPTAIYNLGTALEDLGRPTEAVGQYRKALELHPNFADAHYNLSRLYEKRGNRVGALRHLARYRALTQSQSP